MSITTGYFFNHPMGRQWVAEQINLWLGCALGPYNGNPADLYSRFLGMELSFSEHALLNDRECDFESFKYQLEIRTPMADGDFRGIQVPALLYAAYALFRCLGITGIVVYDLQVLLARYERRDDPGGGELKMYDAVSRKFVQFPGHVADAVARIQDGKGTET